MLEFSSIAAAQHWLDANPDHSRSMTMGGMQAYAHGYGMSPARCLSDCHKAHISYELGNHAIDWTRLKMSARRLSNALAYHYPQMFEPRRAKAA
jgi:hypothetical protein